MSAITPMTVLMSCVVFVIVGVGLYVLSGGMDDDLNDNLNKKRSKQ